MLEERQKQRAVTGGNINLDKQLHGKEEKVTAVAKEMNEEGNETNSFIPLPLSSWK